MPTTLLVIAYVAAGLAVAVKVLRHIHEEDGPPDDLADWGLTSVILLVSPVAWPFVAFFWGLPRLAQVLYPLITWGMNDNEGDA